MRKNNGGIVLTTLFIVVAIIFASGAIAVYTVFMKPETKSQVPELRDKPTIDAVAMAESLGLVVQLEQVASTLPEGRVLAQSPEAGSELRKGQVIVLQVSKGGELHAVPDVKGRTLADAQTEIKAQGFALGDVVRIREPNTQAGTVIAQSPAAPANVAAGRKIDLLVQDGGSSSGVLTVPDVNRMTEKEARDVLTAAGLKVQGTDRVYSPLLPEGLAIETRPAAGSTVRSGQGVILKLATQRRPAGFMDANASSTSTAGGTARRVTSQPDANTSTPQSQPKPQTATTPSTPASPPAQQQEEFTGDDYARTPSRPATSQQPQQRASTPAQPPAQASTPASSGRNKTARIRYVVPPITRPMNLRIEVTDPSGKRDVMNRQVRSGESINTTASYTQECVITIYLGGDFVWQEKQR
ncbi:MAG: PASTA domain-containing protein [Synergistaceae bacterium]|nr:PASTA domain-containing protein [Synergistaceae bacterium]